MVLRLHSIVLFVSIVTAMGTSLAEDSIRVLVPQKGNWETSVPEVAQCIGFVRGYGTAKRY